MLNATRRQQLDVQLQMQRCVGLLCLRIDADRRVGGKELADNDEMTHRAHLICIVQQIVFNKGAKFDYSSEARRTRQGKASGAEPSRA